MADETQVSILKQGTEAWNKWRAENPDAKIDLRGVDLRNEKIGKSFMGAEGKYVDAYKTSGSDFIPPYSLDYSHVNLSEAFLSEAKLYDIDFSHANFKRSYLSGADLERSNLYKADLSYTHFHDANLNGAYVSKANFSWSMASRMKAGEAIFRGVNFKRTIFSSCVMNGANFTGSDFNITSFGFCNLAYTDFRQGTFLHTTFDDSFLFAADFSATVLNNCSLETCTLVQTNFNDTDLSGSKIYGISVWDLKTSANTRMNDLVITKKDDSVITVDDIEVAQFIYLLLNNNKIRNVINTITSKAVLILGRFTPERKKILDEIKKVLRQKNFLPIIFDFEKPDHKDLTETVATLAQMSCFVIADLTDAKSIPQELQKIIPNNPSLPVQPIIAKSGSYYGMFGDLLIYSSVLIPFQYEDEDSLISNIETAVVEPSLQKIKEIEMKRAAIREMMKSAK